MRPKKKSSFIKNLQYAPLYQWIILGFFMFNPSTKITEPLNLNYSCQYWSESKGTGLGMNTIQYNNHGGGYKLHEYNDRHKMPTFYLFTPNKPEIDMPEKPPCTATTKVCHTYSVSFLIH